MAPRRPLLAAGIVLAGLAAAAWRSAGRAFAAPPPSRNAAAPSSRPAAAPPAAALTSRAGGGGAAAAAAAAAVALAAGAGRRAASEASNTPRSERVKGPQELPLARRLQRFFSVRNRQFWDYEVNPRTYFQRTWRGKDMLYATVLGSIHIGAAFAPFYFTWKAFACFVLGYLITGLFGITLSYHRQLAHRSFKTPKWLEYTFAYCGCLALQSHPINWVSSHRHHHGGTESERDVHSPLDGFWWSHAGWLLDAEGTSMRANKSNAVDLSSQWFYRFLKKTYIWHAIILPIIGLYAFGGLPCVLWGFFARICWVWHITWAVNSVSHVWGFKDWNTTDNSMNNWLIGIMAFGEGWHNNHHAFENSCRHGLKWWQIDFTWYTVKLLSFLGLATDLKYPSESKMRKLSFAAA